MHRDIMKSILKSFDFETLYFSPLGDQRRVVDGAWVYLSIKKNRLREVSELEK